uniref:Uncharacterized protein n=1 Tax=Macaca mulatta TaxID=9544 RepID=A0A5F7ZHZ0_MACMU
MQLTRRKLLHLCSAKLQREREIGVAGGGARRSSALQQGGRGSSGTARSLESPASRAGSEAPGAAGRGASVGPGLPRCTWPSPAPPSPRPPPRRWVCWVRRTHRGGSGVCRALFAFRSLAGSLCKPSGVGSTAGEAAGPGRAGSQVVAPGFPRQPPDLGGAPGDRACVCSCVCEQPGCSGLTTRVNLGWIWRQGSRRSYEWCSRHLWVRRRGRRRGGFGAPGPRGQRLLPAGRGAGASGRPGETLSACPDPGQSGAGRASTRGGQPRVQQPISACLPAFLLLFILASFLPSFQSVELLSRQVRSRSRSQGWPRKTSVALKGVLLGDVGRGWLPPYSRWAGGPHPFDRDFPARTKPQAKRGRGRCGPGRGRFVPNSPWCVATVDPASFNSAHSRLHPSPLLELKTRFALGDGRGVPNAKECTGRIRRVCTSSSPTRNRETGRNAPGFKDIYMKAAVKRTLEAEAEQIGAPGFSSASEARIHCT